MTHAPQAQPAAKHFQGLLAKLAATNGGVKSVGEGMKSLVALLDIINSPSPDISEQLRQKLSVSALRMARRILTETHTAHKQMLTHLRAFDELTVVDCSAAEALRDAEPREESPHD